ncbi:MAG: hypothetical protein Q7S12_03040, partial [bacterium]|nr:hypothetical protein [bacterium]
MHSNLKILFLDILTDSEKERKRVNKIVYGGRAYSEAMSGAFGLPKNKWATLYASHGKLPKILNAFDAIVIGGSMHDSIKRNEKPWMKRTFKFIEKVAEQNIP